MRDAEGDAADFFPRAPSALRPEPAGHPVEERANIGLWRPVPNFLHNSKSLLYGGPNRLAMLRGIVAAPAAAARATVTPLSKVRVQLEVMRVICSSYCITRVMEYEEQITRFATNFFSRQTGTSPPVYPAPLGKAITGVALAAAAGAPTRPRGPAGHGEPPARGASPPPRASGDAS